MRPTEKFVFIITSAILIASFLYIVQFVNNSLSTEVPAYGGTYQEGVVGYTRFINPVLAFTDADKDMSALVYSGLLKPTENGKLEGDLAESWVVSPDGLTYTITLKPNVFFHDGTPVTTADVAYTIEKIIDPTIKSPKAESWGGVTVTVIDESHISFTLKKPYTPFIENLTLGILPKHIWKNISDDTFDTSTYNREPIGSGPFKIKKAYKNDSGIYEYYDLIGFDKYALKKPFLSHFIMRFYKNDADALYAYKQGYIQGLGGISPTDAYNLHKSGSYIVNATLPRVFGVFFNQSVAPVLLNKEVRKALDVSVDRTALIREVLKGWGTPNKSPIPSGLSVNYNLTTSNDNPIATEASSTLTISNEYIEAGKKILIENGWKLNSDGIFEKSAKKPSSSKAASTNSSIAETLKFNLSVPNVPELISTATILKDTWAKLGAQVTIQIFESSDLAQKVIRPRAYDALLFGQVVGRDVDLFPFWHSSQRNDPGLNIALYTNIKADKYLETSRTSSDETKRSDAFRAFETEITNDIPAVFLYSPNYIYGQNKGVHGIEISNITSASERFMNVSNWHSETERVWNIFIKK